MIKHRMAGLEDAALLGALNRELIQDEGHRNPMSVEELGQRMTDWLSSNYKAVVFTHGEEVAAYALYRAEEDHIYLRQFFVQRHLRRVGVGKKCVETLFLEIWPRMRVTVEVLSANQTGLAFWKAVGFAEYTIALESSPREGKRMKGI